jgi:hypothetical protein
MERNIITLEERTMVKEAVILTYILDMLDLERKKLENSMNLLRNAHMEVLEAVFDRARMELIGIKKELKARNIKYNDGHHQDFILEFEIWCRGYKSIFHITRDHARSELGVKLGKVSGEIEAKLKGRR